MMQTLLSLQFSFLMVPVLMIGLLVFGSDFKQGSGWIYVSGLLLITLLHLGRRFWVARLNPLATNAIAMLGAICGFFAYQPMHVGYWDERDYLQGVLVSLLAISSFIVGVKAQYRCRELSWKTSFLSGFVIVSSWVLAAYYTMFPLLAVALLLFISLFGESSASEADRAAAQPLRRSAGFRYRYGAFLVFLDMFLVVWDFKVNTEWAFYISVSFLLTFVLLMLGNFSRFWLLVIYLIGASNYFLAIYFPQFVLYYAHSVWAGLALGALLKQIMQRSEGKQSNDAFNLWGSFILALGVGYAFYANLLEASWRGILFVPLVLGLVLAPHKRHIRKSQ